MRNPFSEIKDRAVIFDGAMGTALQERGLLPGELPETWCVDRPGEVLGVHLSYLEAGADVVTTNTFGANSLKFGKGGGRPLAEIISSAVKIAREAAEKHEKKTGKRPLVALDVGPTGRMLKPFGDLPFEDAVGIFKETAAIGEACGADFVLIETMNDAYELKAAVLAAKEATSLPVFATCVFDESSRLMTGADPIAVAALLDGLRADAVGVNCGFGPDRMRETVDTLLEYSHAPVIVNPNAGLPSVRDGRTVYDVSPGEFASVLAGFVKKGVRAVGGCCGTTPEYIKAVADAARGIAPPAVTPREAAVVTSGMRARVIGDVPAVIGERINPTGKKKIKEALKEENYGVIYEEAAKEEENGADILDVNAGLPGIDERSVLRTLVEGVGEVSALPLAIDTSDPAAMESALRAVNGKALVNSVNGKDEVLDSILPLAAKYGGVVIGLTLDGDGIPDSAEGRLAVARKICERARLYGIEKRDIVIDPLVMAVSADPLAARATLDSVSLIKRELGVAVSLGVSNVSFGLPGRDTLNSVFLAEALSRGLDAAIVNPSSRLIMNTFRAHAALAGADPGFSRYIAAAEGEEKPAAEETISSLTDAVRLGVAPRAAELTAELLRDTEPLEVIDRFIIPALDRVGADFGEKRIYLPSLLLSAEAASAAFDVIKRSMKKEEGKDRGGVVLATVKGDIHDIGKNIVRTLLENFGFTVYDLGRDVPPEAVLEAALRRGVSLVGLSALMTTTVPAMEETVKLIHERAPGVKVAVGGAVLTPEYAEAIGADRYCRDAMEAVNYAKEIYGA